MSIICRAGYSRGVSFVILANGNDGIEAKLKTDVFPYKKTRKLFSIDDANVWVDKEIMKIKGCEE